MTANQESTFPPTAAVQTLNDQYERVNGELQPESDTHLDLMDTEPMNDKSATEQVAAKKSKNLKLNLYCILTALGIILCFSTYAYFMEKVTRGCFAVEDAHGKCSVSFSYAQSLSGVCLVVYWAVARLMLLLRPPDRVDETSVKFYIGCALAYVLAFVTSTMALKWVAYPVQIVAKSAKPIPVIILGAVMGGKTYTYRKYFCVLLIVVGVTLFMYKDNGTNKNYTGFGWGEPLLIFSLIMDGVLGALEERLRKNTNPSALQMMAAFNGWGALLVLVPILITNEGVEFVKFTVQYPSVLLFIGALVVTGAIGQIFIFAMVSMFGALACSVTTTIRKVISLLFSALFMGNVLIAREWGGAALVFGALFADMLFRKKAEPEPMKS